jgi:hypothetical protein
MSARLGFAGSYGSLQRPVFPVAKMLADTVETVETHYAQFVPAARDAAQITMDAGVGIEEQGEVASQRGRHSLTTPVRSPRATLHWVAFSFCPQSRWLGSRVDPQKASFYKEI